MAVRPRTHDPPKLGPGWSTFTLQPHETDLGLVGDEGAYFTNFSMPPPGSDTSQFLGAVPVTKEKGWILSWYQVLTLSSSPTSQKLLLLQNFCFQGYFLNCSVGMISLLNPLFRTDPALPVLSGVPQLLI